MMTEKDNTHNIPSSAKIEVTDDRYEGVENLKHKYSHSTSLGITSSDLRHSTRCGYSKRDLESSTSSFSEENAQSDKLIPKPVTGKTSEMFIKGEPVPVLLLASNETAMIMDDYGVNHLETRHKDVEISGKPLNDNDFFSGETSSDVKINEIKHEDVSSEEDVNDTSARELELIKHEMMLSSKEYETDISDRKMEQDESKGPDDNKMEDNSVKRKRMTSQWCSAIGCKNGRYKSPGLSFFRFPRDKERCKLWVLNCGREDLLKKSAEDLYQGNVLCSLHFETSQFTTSLRNRLRPLKAVPTLFSLSNSPAVLEDKRPPPKEENHSWLVCDVASSSRFLLDGEHNNATVTKEKPFTHGECSENFRPTSELCKHIKTDKEKQFTSSRSECSHISDAKNALALHMKGHTNSNRFCYDTCSLNSFSSSSSADPNHDDDGLKKDVGVQTESRLFVCNECRKYFAVKPFALICKECELLEADADFIEHMTAYTGGKKPSSRCNIAGEAEIEKDLTILTLQLGRKLFSCNECDKDFQTVSDLITEHIKSHKGGKPSRYNKVVDTTKIEIGGLGIKHVTAEPSECLFSCNHCGKDFQTIGDLIIEHVKSHTGVVEPYRCNQLDESSIGNNSEQHKHRKSQRKRKHAKYTPK